MIRAVAPALLLVQLLALPALAQDAPCPDGQVGTVELTRALGTAEAYFSSLNVDGFKRATDEARALVPCLDEPVPRTLAAELHRFQGIRAFVDRDLAAAQRSFTSARSIEPDYSFPTYLVPEGNPLLAQYAAADPTDPATRKVGKPRKGRLQFDGEPSLDRPTERPTVAQHLDERGRVVSTAYLAPGDTLFAYEIELVRPWEKRKMRWAGASMGSSALLWASAWQARSTYESPTLQHDQLDAQRDTVNSLTATSALFALVAGGLATWAVLDAPERRP